MHELIRIVPSEGINVRKYASEKAPLVCRVKKNEVFFVDEEENNWLRILLSKTKKGYVYKPFVNFIYEKPIDTRIVKIKAEKANIRRLPGVNSEIVATGEKEESFQVLGSFDGWIKGMTERNEEGFIYEDLLDMNSTLFSKYEKKGPDYAPVSRKVERKRKFSYNVAQNKYVKLEQNNSGKAKIMLTGDLMCEQKMYKAYNYDGKFLPYDIFYYAKKIFMEADLVAGNLETMICETAPYTGEQYKINGKYHCNAPSSYLDILKYVGFDLFVMANNHNLDCGVKGIQETIERVEKKEILHTGLYTNPYEKDRFIIVDINGIKVAFLSYSTWFNRNLCRLTEEGKGLLNIYKKEVIEKNIRCARKAGAEYVIVYMHWGIDAEYKHEFSLSQKKQAKEIADAGADYIIGSHTHSLQGFEYVVNKEGKNVPVAYSLGNFATSEINEISRLNAILVLELEKKEKKVVCKTSYIPCYVFDSFEGRRYPIVPLVERFNEKYALQKVKEKRCLAGYVFNMEIPEYGVDISEGISKNLIISAIGDNQNIDKKNNEYFSCLRFAEDAVKDCAAFILPITSNPKTSPTLAKKEMLADLATDRGAKCLITDEQIKDYNCLIVNNVFETWCKTLAKLRKWTNAKVVGITGSIGKTTATEMTYQVLASKFNTHHNTGSANNVRYTGNVLQKLKSYHEIYVQEIMEGPPYGVAATISNYIRPDIAVVTKIGTSHIEAFGNIDRTTESCFGIEEGMPCDGKIIINADDLLQCNYKKKHECITYGIDSKNCDFRAVDIKQKISGIYFNIEYQNTCQSIHLNCIGKHNVYNALVAFAVAKLFGIKEHEIVNALEAYRTSGIRQNLIKVDDKSVFLDCYNASTESIKGAIESIELIKNGNKAVAIIGDVLELGEKSYSEHEQIGEYLLNSNIDIIVLYGNYVKNIYEILKGTKVVYYTNDFNELVILLKKLKNENDLFLFKGSHGMQLEKAVDYVWGTWYHEEFERYDHIAKEKVINKLKCMEYSDHVVIIGSCGNKEELNIPEKIEGKIVTGIERTAFSRNNKIKRIGLSKGLKNIRYCSFYKCNSIEEIVIPEGIKILDKSAFSTCENLKNVKIGEGLTDLKFRAFGNCVNLESIYLPKSIKNIEKEVFLNCKKITIYCFKNSVAEKYAEEHNIPYTILDEIKNEKLRTYDKGGY